MAIIASHEVLPRTFTHRFGDRPQAQRTYVVVTDGPESHGNVLTYLAIQHGTPHPEFNALTCHEIAINEIDKWHLEVTYSYEQPEADGDKPDGQPPYLQPDVWSFSGTSSSVAATQMYLRRGDAQLGGLEDFNPVFAQLANGAGDPIPGMMRGEPELKATISGFREKWPLATVTAIIGGINKTPWGTGARHTWQCVAIGGKQETGFFNGVPIEYWSFQTDLVYRPSTHNLFLPHVGFNYIEDGKKKRAYVIDPESGDKVPSADPIALNFDGTRRGDEYLSDPPGTCEYQVHPEIEFSQYFGDPPAGVL